MGTCCLQASEEPDGSRPYVLLLWRLRRHSRSKIKKPRTTRAAAILAPEASDEHSSAAWRALWAAVWVGRGTLAVPERHADHNQRAEGQSLDGPLGTDEAVLLAD
jgi:hypothetical protein